VKKVWQGIDKRMNRQRHAVCICSARGAVSTSLENTLMPWKITVPAASVAVILLLSAAVLRGDTSAAPANPARTQTAGLMAIFDRRSQTIKTLEAARASAEADLREAINRRPVDEALVRSLTAEIVNFGHQLVDDEEQMRSAVDRLLRP
jgi:hypothetical protein